MKKEIIPNSESLSNSKQPIKKPYQAIGKIGSVPETRSSSRHKEIPNNTHNTSNNNSSNNNNNQLKRKREETSISTSSNNNPSTNTTNNNQTKS